MKAQAITLSLVTILLSLAAVLATGASARSFSAWEPAQSAEQAGGSSHLNTEYLEGCPIESLDGRMLFFASNRPGGLGGIDIWIATRPGPGHAWGEPYNPGASINSAADDFCPTPVTSRVLFFVSTREGGCGGPDIYHTRLDSRTGWSTPENLGCDVNSPAAEFSPSIVNISGEPQLYFSSNRSGGFSPENDTQDIYVSRYLPFTGWSSPELVPNLNTAFDDARPNVRRNGREIVFDSTRPGGLGGPDIWAAYRDSPFDEWSEPVNLGPNVNSSAAETRPSLSRDGRRLLFGSNRPGGEGNSDIYISERMKGTD